jgi:hypothetical protein
MSSRALLELGLEAAGDRAAPDEAEEAVEEGRRVVGTLGPELGAPRDERLHGGIAACDPERRRLHDRERAHGVRAQRRSEQRDDAAVRVRHDVHRLVQELGHERRLGLEVAALERRAPAEAGSVGEEERPPLGERELLAPREPRAGHAAVDEQDGRAVAEPLDVQGHSSSRSSA